MDKAGISKAELEGWNKELTDRVFFSADGFEEGEEDQKVWAKVKVLEAVDQALYPNLWRWHKLLSKKRNDSGLSGKGPAAATEKKSEETSPAK